MVSEISINLLEDEDWSTKVAYLVNFYAKKMST